MPAPFFSSSVPDTAALTTIRAHNINALGQQPPLILACYTFSLMG